MTGVAVTYPEKRIVVPEGMFNAALKHQDSGIQCVRALEAALRWLTENPISPTAAQAREVMGPIRVMNETTLIMAIEAWQRRMFLAPEPEVPEAVKDLIWSESLYRGDHRFYDAIPSINKNILEAYRRGKESK